MPHKRYSKASIDAANKSITYFDDLILRAKAISRGGEQALKVGLKIIEDMELDSRLRKDSLLLTGDTKDANMARSYLAKQEAYQDVITLFKKPDAMIDMYKSEKRKSEEYIEGSKHGTAPDRKG